MSEEKSSVPTEVSPAENYKNKANEYFKRMKAYCFKFVFQISNVFQICLSLFYIFLHIGKEYDKAIEMYTKAIELEPNTAVYYANRSLAHLRQESFGSALEDGVLAVKNDPTYIKGYYRRAAAQMSLGKFKKALTDFEFVAKRRPNDRDAAMKYTECNKLVRKQAFEKAISSDVPEKTLAEIHSDLEAIGKKLIFDSRYCFYIT